MNKWLRTKQISLLAINGALLFSVGSSVWAAGNLAQEDGVSLHLSRDKITLAALDVVKLAPRARISPMVSDLASIPLESIQSFLVNHLVVDDQVKRMAYVVAGDTGHIIMGKGDRFYARGELAGQEGVSLGVYRKGKTYTDPDTREVLGTQMNVLGVARVDQVEGDVATMRLLSSHENIGINDWLLPTEGQRLDSQFEPKPPSSDVNGKIIDVLNGVHTISQYATVVINRGTREGLEVGNLLAVYHQGERIRDKNTRQLIQLPAERGGEVMIYKVFNKISFGLVLKETTVLSINDIVKNP